VQKERYIHKRIFASPKFDLFSSSANGSNASTSNKGLVLQGNISNQHRPASGKNGRPRIKYIQNIPTISNATFPSPLRARWKGPPFRISLRAFRFPLRKASPNCVRRCATSCGWSNEAVSLSNCWDRESNSWARSRLWFYKQSRQLIINKKALSCMTLTTALATNNRNE